MGVQFSLCLDAVPPLVGAQFASTEKASVFEKRSLVLKQVMG